MNKAKWILAGLLALSSAANAQVEEWYVGVGAGVTNVRELCDGVPGAFCDDDGATARVIAGWKINPYLVLEAQIDFSGGFTSPGARAVGYDGDTSVSFLGLNLIGFLPLGPRVSLFGGLSGAFGYVRTDVYEYYDTQDCDSYYDSYYDDWSYYCRNNGYEDEYETNSTVVGGALAGVQINMSKWLQLRLQAQRYFNMDGGIAFGDRRAVDTASINLIVPFGTR
ncbi:MAG TPA: outer membrane beta-barrel protein [Steroidobacteraceae bacterium]|nr:outer membrane beta-barrel protein [Steroidobacteraceae bacterium]